MDCTALDVTDVTEAKEGDVVTVFGHDDSGRNLPLTDLAALYPGGGSEVTTVINRRVPRVYYKNGRIVGAMDLLHGLYRPIPRK